MLTQDELKEVLEYDEETGLFTWIKVKVSLLGETAGSFNDQGYVIIVINQKKYRAHRLAWLYMTGEFPEQEIDHLNHQRDDNRFVNLREANRTDNMRNISMSSKNTSGVTGVCWIKDRCRWRASISVDDKTIFLGQFAEFHEAVNARKNAEVLYQYHANHGQ